MYLIFTSPLLQSCELLMLQISKSIICLEFSSGLVILNLCLQLSSGLVYLNMFFVSSYDIQGCLVFLTVYELCFHMPRGFQSNCQNSGQLVCQNQTKVKSKDLKSAFSGTFIVVSLPLVCNFSYDNHIFTSCFLYFFTFFCSLCVPIKCSFFICSVFTCHSGGDTSCIRLCRGQDIRCVRMGHMSGQCSLLLLVQSQIQI